MVSLARGFSIIVGMHKSDSNPQGADYAPRRHWPKFAGWAAAVAVIALIALLAPRWSRAQFRYDLLARLHDGEPVERKRAAWTVADYAGAYRDAKVEMALVRGVMGDETNADVRESLVYTLGWIGDPTHADAILHAATLDETGLVRCAAWLAAARVDAQLVRRWLREVPPPDTDWDRLGRGQARLWIGDMSGLTDVLQVAKVGTLDQQTVACRALHKTLRPLLVAVGRWPVDADPPVGRTWDADLLAEIERRCTTIDMQRIADDTWPAFQQTTAVRREVQRMNHGRDLIASLLFGTGE